MNNKKDSKKWLIYFILGGFVVELLRFLYKTVLSNKVIKDNVDDFIKEEKREIAELRTGQENFKKYCQDSCSLVVDYFIPHECNDFKPKILRTKSLVIILVAMFAFKVALAGYLFIIYPNEAQMAEQMANEVLQLTNADRVKNGLQPLTLNPTLVAAAQAKADDMDAKDYFSHYGPDGKKPWDWINRGQYAYILAGENLGMNFATADAVNTALMNSPSHRHNILNDNYKDIGIAVISATIDGQKTNLLVEMFGKEAGENLAVQSKAVATIAGTTPANPSPAKTKTKVAGTAVTKPVAPSVTKEIAQADNFTSHTEVKSATLIAQSQPKVNTPTVDVVKSDVSLSDLNNQTQQVALVPDDQVGSAAILIQTSKIVFAVVLTLMVIALLLNIFVRFTVQHKPIIIQTLVVILLIAGMTLIKTNLLESIGHYIVIL